MIHERINTSISNVDMNIAHEHYNRANKPSLDYKQLDDGINPSLHLSVTTVMLSLCLDKSLPCLRTLDQPLDNLSLRRD